MTKYPSLYAALEPSTAPDGKRGATVRCTATRRDLGFIWWSSTAKNGVVWNWRTGAHFGERTTERNAVQALRDVSNATGQKALPFAPADFAPAPTPAPVRRSAPVSPAPTPGAARQIVWGTDGQAPNLTAAIAAAFAKVDKS